MLWELKDKIRLRINRPEISRFLFNVKPLPFFFPLPDGLQRKMKMASRAHSRVVRSGDRLSLFNRISRPHGKSIWFYVPINCFEKTFPVFVFKGLGCPHNHTEPTGAVFSRESNDSIMRCVNHRPVRCDHVYSIMSFHPKLGVKRQCVFS